MHLMPNVLESSTLSPEGQRVFSDDGLDGRGAGTYDDALFSFSSSAPSSRGFIKEPKTRTGGQGDQHVQAELVPLPRIRSDTRD